MNELMLATDTNACISGLVYIVDYEQATANHYLQMTPNTCKKLVAFLEKSMPLRIKSIYYVNTSTAAQNFFKIFYPFLSDKIKQRVSLDLEYNILEKFKPLFHHSDSYCWS